MGFHLCEFQKRTKLHKSGRWLSGQGKEAQCLGWAGGTRGISWMLIMS